MSYQIIRNEYGTYKIIRDEKGVKVMTPFWGAPSTRPKPVDLGNPTLSDNRIEEIVRSIVMR